MFFKNFKNTINIENHFLGLNRILENKLLLNTLYLIFIILTFTIILFLIIKKEKKYFLYLIDSNIVESIIWIIPSIIIFFISLYTIKSSFFLNQFNKIYLNIKPLIIESVSLNWIWIFIYPIQKILTFNEICLPLFIPIKIYIISNSIMNSLCIPKIGCHIYCMNKCLKYSFFISLKHGLSHGFSTNYSGIGFKNMRINIFFVLKSTFYYWIKCIKKSIYFDINKYNFFIKRGFLTYDKFFKTKNNKIFFSIINKK